jgi:hypothetical protein
MTTTTDTSNIPNVTAVTREDLERDMEKFGAAYGKGQNSRPSALMRCVEVASKINIGPDDAKDIYLKFQQAAAKSRGVEYSVESSFKVQVSKLRQGLTMGSMPAIDAVQVMHDALDVIQELSGLEESPMRGSAYDNLVNVCRAQIKAGTLQLTKDDIKGLLSQTPEEKTLLDKVMDQYKRTYRLNDELVAAGEDNINVSISLEALKDQIKCMDGEVPAMTKADKAKAAAFKVLKSQGIVLTPAGNVLSA